MVKTLLRLEDVNPNQQDVGGWILLRCSYIKPDKPGKFDLTPLWWAFKNRHDRVVKMLLGHDGVSLDKQDEYGRAPLC